MASTKRTHEDDDLDSAHRSSRRSHKFTQQMPDIHHSPDAQQILTTQDDSKDKPFRFLDLAAELRDNVYARALEDYPTWLSNKRGSGKLTTSCPLICVSKQISSEFKHISRTEAMRPIQTAVYDYDYRHIISYVDSLSDVDFRHLEKRSMKVILDFFPSHTSPGPDVWLGYVDVWRSWVHDSARAIAVDFSYEWVANKRVFVAYERVKAAHLSDKVTKKHEPSAELAKSDYGVGPGSVYGWARK